MINAFLFPSKKRRGKKMALQQTCPVRKQARQKCTTGFWNNTNEYTFYFPATDNTDKGQPTSCQLNTAKNPTCNSLNEKYPGTKWAGQCNSSLHGNCPGGQCQPFCYIDSVASYGQTGVNPNWKNCCLGTLNDNCRCSPDWC